MICLKFTTFVVATTVSMPIVCTMVCCDLLKIYYLCGSNNSDAAHYCQGNTVLICLKFTTFVVATTVDYNPYKRLLCCDLLKIYYLCGSNNSRLTVLRLVLCVVICLKFTTFVVATTVL